MTENGKGSSGTAPGARKGDGTRADRLRAALRQNLKRRKSQARERSQAPAPSHDSAGILPDNGTTTSQG